MAALGTRVLPLQQNRPSFPVRSCSHMLANPQGTLRVLGPPHSQVRGWSGWVGQRFTTHNKENPSPPARLAFFQESLDHLRQQSEMGFAAPSICLQWCRCLYGRGKPPLSRAVPSPCSILAPWPVLSRVLFCLLLQEHPHFVFPLLPALASTSFSQLCFTCWSG